MSGVARILVVDDEPQIHRFLHPTLAAAGYEVEAAHAGAEALRLAAIRAPDLLLLDLGLPDLDGLAVLQQLRQFSRVPVIILSARDRVADKIAALDAGADDYVEKPFDVGELLARVRAALRHGAVGASGEPVVRSGRLEVDLERRMVRVGSGVITLSPREYDVLAMLARNVGRVVTHRQMLTAIWGPAHHDDVQYLRVCIGHLRQKLGADAAQLLLTEPGVGYRMAEQN